MYNWAQRILEPCFCLDYEVRESPVVEAFWSGKTRTNGFEGDDGANSEGIDIENVNGSEDPSEFSETAFKRTCPPHRHHEPTESFE